MPPKRSNNLGVFHYLNVLDGDCSIIQHPSDHVSIIDVNNAKPYAIPSIFEKLGKGGNFRQKDIPVNPIGYLDTLGVTTIFRFILTHPDMDHMGGIKMLFDKFSPTNFWDTDNKIEKEFEETIPYDEKDWLFYKKLRDDNPSTDPKRIVLNAGAIGKYYNQDENGQNGGDGLYVLAPTKDLAQMAIDNKDCNDGSYVILYRSQGGRVLLTGDSHDKSWEYILAHNEDDIKDIDVLIAPHHGRKSDRSFDFLDVVKPTLTFFGNAPSEYLAYGEWSRRNLPVITNNQANCMILDTNVKPINLYVTNRVFARSLNVNTTWNDKFNAYYVGYISRD